MTPQNHRYQSQSHALVSIVVLIGLAIGNLSPASLARASDAVESNAAPAAQASVPPARVGNRPKVPGVLRLNARRRIESPQGSWRFTAADTSLDWNVSETAIVICDMWDNLYCQAAAQRVAEMAPRMNRVVMAARSLGVMIIHAPSGTVDRYAGTPYRLRMQQAETFKPPVPLRSTCPLDPKREGNLPIDDSHPCDDPVVGPMVNLYTKEHPAIQITGFDGISDKGDEIYNFCRQEGIKNIVMMGVHTNMCVLARPFGIRQMVTEGMNVVLARDLTDAMYDPRQPPHVSHARGVELVIEHIERYWCPSIISDDLTRVVPGSDGPK
jgi:nicotinamidase-related amidase